MKQQYHFIGIGGIGMAALASLLLDKEYNVSGSDVKNSPLIEQLINKGAKVFIGHDEKNIEGASVIIYSSAVKEDNPEIKAARKLNLLILKRADLLAELMKEYVGVTVSGAHGKTTTTSMISNLLFTAGLNPTTAVGGIVKGASYHARWGSGKYFVAELDESDGSFLKFEPTYSIITNIDYEHVDYFGNWDNILNAYEQFVNKTKDDGLVLAYSGDLRLLEVISKTKRAFQTYGFSSGDDFHASRLDLDDFSSNYDCYSAGRFLGEISLSVPGKHNILNSLACVGLGLNLGIDFSVIQHGLKSFQGVNRRLQLKGDICGIKVLDDYAHHPSEIRMTLAAAKNMKSSRLIVVFQPHRYSRLKFLFDEFVNCLSSLPYLIVTNLYAASEQPIEGVSSDILCEEIRKKGNDAVFCLNKEKIVPHLLEIVKPDDIVLFMGAGDITNYAGELAQRLEVKTMCSESLI